MCIYFRNVCVQFLKIVDTYKIRFCGIMETGSIDVVKYLLYIFNVILGVIIKNTR